MGDRPGTFSRVRTSEDKVRRKDLCWSVRVCLCPIKLPDVRGPGRGEAGRFMFLAGDDGGKGIVLRCPREAMAASAGMQWRP